VICPKGMLRWLSYVIGILDEFGLRAFFKLMFDRV
jgi:hypothetical protein